MEPTPQTKTSRPLLKIEGLTKDFRGLRALDDINLHVNEDEILGVIGPNGAGKTTLFNLITGLLPPSRGKIYFLEREITNLGADIVTHAGIARTFQNIRLFCSLSVLENVRVAQQLHIQTKPLSVFLSSPDFRRSEKELEAKSLDLLRFFGLERYRDLPAGNLPYGDQRRLEIARALATSPRLLLLDEPTVGMNPTESQVLLELILKLHELHHLMIILIAHDMHLVMGLCHRIQVINEGKTLAIGEPAEVRILPQVIKAYLGSSADA
jgi:branched-chain amino acid transport system ATP-binding protein